MISITRRVSRYRLALFAAVVIGELLANGSAHAQGSLSPGLSPSLSDPLSASSSIGGYDTTFGPDAGTITGNELRTGVSDPTNSQLLGSAISPLDNSYANSSVSTSPQTGTLTDAQQAVGSRDPSFGVHYSQGFSPTSTLSQAASFTGRQVASGSFGTASTQSAFTASASGKPLTKAADAAPSTTSGELGQGVSTQASLLGIDMMMQTSSPGSGLSYYATDPVLTGSTSGYEADLELAGDMASPSSQTGGFFAESTAAQVRFQYDDGQTPSRDPVPAPGQISGAAPEYAPSPSGFPDSTKGLAGLPTEASNQTSPFRSLSNPSTSSPFAPVSDGTVYGLTLRFNPNLHALPAPAAGSFEAYERRAQEQRIMQGYSISQASSAHQQDLREYQSRNGKGQRRSTRPDFSNQSGQGYRQELMGVPKVR